MSLNNSLQFFSDGAYVVIAVASIPTVVVGGMVIHGGEKPLGPIDQRALVWSITTSILGGLFGVAGICKLSEHLPWMATVCVTVSLWTAYCTLAALAKRVQL